MPVGKLDDFLFIAIESLKNQTFKDYVCYILTSGFSVDDLNKLDHYLSNDNRFTVHSLKLGGIAFALNYGINMTSTKYVARMDGDDISHNSRFAKQIDFLENNPRYVIVGCRVELIDENGNILNQKFKFYEENNQIRTALKYRMPLCHPGLLFRSDILFKMKGYLYGNSCEDHELYIRIARDDGYLFKNLPENLFKYRRHSSQLTNKAFSRKAFTEISGFLFTEFLNTKNPMYLLGILANHPYFRHFRSIFRDFIYYIIKFYRLKLNQFFKCFGAE